MCWKPVVRFVFSINWFPFSLFGDHCWTGIGWPMGLSLSWFVPVELGVPRSCVLHQAFTCSANLDVYRQGAMMATRDVTSMAAVYTVCSAIFCSR